jgi:predicted transposase YbfD/YdcC
LTANELKVTTVRPLSGFDEGHALGFAALTGSDGGPDPVDSAIRSAAASHAVADLPKLLTFLLDPAAFQRSFADWIAALAESGVGIRRTIPIDGKTVRRSGRRKHGLAPLHLVSAWAGANHVSLGQVAVDQKSNEITAIPRLLELLDIKGALVTIDAMGCQKEIAAKIVGGGGDYILAVKDNPPHLHQDIDDSFMAAMDDDFAGLEWSVARTEETNRGRREVRECHMIVRPEGLRDAGLWKGLAAICMLMSRRVVDGVESVEFR